MIRSKGEAGTGNVVEAVRHMRAIRAGIDRLGSLAPEELHAAAKDLRAPYDLVARVAAEGRLPVVLFSAGGIATPADAALMMQLGAEGVFVGSGIYKSQDPPARARAIVEAADPLRGPRGPGARLARPQGRDAGHRDLLPGQRGAAAGPRVVTSAPRRPRVGVLAVQGAFAEHERVLAAVGAEPVQVRGPEELEGLDAIVIPGGESTTLGLVAEESGLLAALRERLAAGMPALGTCAGMVVLARATTGGAQPLVGGMDIVVRRNAFGRQRSSFETALAVPALGAEPVDAVFIRAPWIEEAGPGRGDPGRALRPSGRRPPGRAAGDGVPPRAVGGATVSRMARGAGAPPARVAGARGEAGTCRDTVSGRPSSARRARPTPSAGSSSRSSRGPSSWPPRRAGATPTPTRPSPRRSRRRATTRCPRTTSSARSSAARAPARATTTSRCSTRATRPAAWRSSARSSPTTATAPPATCASSSPRTAAPWARPAAWRGSSTARA